MRRRKRAEPMAVGKRFHSEWLNRVEEERARKRAARDGVDDQAVIREAIETARVDEPGADSPALAVVAPGPAEAPADATPAATFVASYPGELPEKGLTPEQIQRREAEKAAL